MTAELKIGDEVVRVTGGFGAMGSKGQVVEIADGRVRVFWHTPSNTHTAPKRTWVKLSAVRKAE